MKIAKNPELSKAILYAEQAYASMKEVGRDDIAKQLEAMIKAAKEQKFVVGVVGSAKRGKSTLINGFLGRTDDKLAPIGTFPATNVISIFRRADADKASIKVHFKDEGKTNIEISEDEVRSYASEDHNPDNKKNVRSIEAEGPFPGLEDNVHIVDTPGANNALSAMHGDILLNFLPHADALIFLVTAGEPLVKSESDLLREIRDIQKKNIRKIFFAINKVDEADSDELAEGIEHNREILDFVGFEGIKIYRISAKDYFEKRSDPGTEMLISDIRQTIANDRIKIIAERINERTRVLLEQVKRELASELDQAKATVEDLTIERAQLEMFKRELQQGRETRERLFVQEWNDAFSDLESKIGRTIRKNLKDKYGQLVDETSGVKVQALAQTIHGDVAVGFSKELGAAIEDCEHRLDKAQMDFLNAVQTTVISIIPDVSPGSTVTSDLTGALKIGASTIPGIVTGAISSSLPGLIGSAIVAGAPTVAAAVWYNPFTWIASAATGGASALVATLGASATGLLTTVAMPFAFAAFGYATYRGFSTWRLQKDLDKNKLKTALDRMIDEGCESVLDQVRSYKEKVKPLLKKINDDLDQKLAAADVSLEELIRNRPSPEKIAVLERNVGNQVLLLAAPGVESVERGQPAGPMADKYFK